jgi:alkanesulfonate monooxygenase SsuD/methylene tetrahydromethanopterin reductase-like flavin-dependent oxidoreductase (luciferase family)
MLRLTGRLGDGWLPSLGGRYMSTDDAPRMQTVVDEAARSAGRDPSEVERAVNVMVLEGEPWTWADQLARVRLHLAARGTPARGRHKRGAPARRGSAAAPARAGRLIYG